MKKIIVLSVCFVIFCAITFHYAKNYYEASIQPRSVPPIYFSADTIVTREGIKDTKIDTDKNTISLLDSKGRAKFVICFDKFTTAGLNRFNHIAYDRNSTTRIKFLPESTAIELYLQ